MGIKRLISTRGLEPIARHIPFSPSTITLFSLLFAFISAYFIFSSCVAYGALFALIALLLDGIDGIVARAKRQATRFGAYFDGISDRIVEFVILASMLGLAWPNPTLASYSIIIIIAFGTFLTSFAKAYADHKGTITKSKIKKMHCLFERAERSIFIFASLLLYILEPSLSMYLLALTSALSVIAFLQRFIFVFRYSMGR